jgi:hypothetical protein
MQRPDKRSGAPAPGDRGPIPIAQLVAVALLIALGCQSKDSGGSATIASTESAMSTSGAPIKQSSAEQPLAPEKDPPGGVPKDQQFVLYKSSTAGYQLEVPKGWVSTENNPNVTFINGVDGLNLAISPSNSPPTAASVRDNEARLIQAQGRAVKIGKVSSVKLPGGTAVEIQYTSNSDPDSAGKAMRLQNTAYLFFNNGTVGWLTMWAPQGADISALNRAAKTFKWQ